MIRTIWTVWTMIYPRLHLRHIRLAIIRIEPKCVTGILGVSPKQEAYSNYYSPSPSGDQIRAVWTVWTIISEGCFTTSGERWSWSGKLTLCDRLKTRV